MIPYLMIGALLLLCLLLLVRLHRTQLQWRQLLHVIRANKNGQAQKAFTREKGVSAETVFALNELIDVYRTQLSDLKRLEQANKELLTGLSHDVRTPLTTLLGYMDAMRQGVVTGEEKEQYLAIAHSKAYHLKELVDTLFDWFKIDANEMRLTLAPADLCEMTREAVIAWLPLLEQRQIELTTQIPDEEIIIQADPQAFQRIFHNLMQNAVTHGACSRLLVTVTKENETVCLTIRDNGNGIAAERLPHIFDRLYKGESARGSHGSGLGLYIVKALTQMQGGSITAASSPGVHCTFALCFPSA